jgi:arginine decarboxylase
VLQPRWIPPRSDADLHLTHAPSPAAVEDALNQYPDAAAALVVSPTPHGTAADHTAIAEICHARGKPLIVDEAWGAHLPFHDHLPTWAMDARADVCVVSVHKNGRRFGAGDRCSMFRVTFWTSRTYQRALTSGPQPHTTASWPVACG